MPRLGLSDQDPDTEEEGGNHHGRRRGVIRSCFADDTAVEPVAATAQRRPFSARTRRDDVGRRGGRASAGAGEQSAVCVRDGRCRAPRTAALLRTVQRGDYGTLSRLLGQSHRFVRVCLRLFVTCVFAFVRKSEARLGAWVAASPYV